LFEEYTISSPVGLVSVPLNPNQPVPWRSTPPDPTKSVFEPEEKPAEASIELTFCVALGPDRVTPEAAM